VAAQAPTVAGAKQVGWLGLVPLPRLMAEFERGMRELGYVEGTTYALVALYAGDKPETLQSLAAELVRRKPDVIVGEAFAAVQALQRTTKTWLPAVDTHRARRFRERRMSSDASLYCRLSSRSARSLLGPGLISPLATA